MAGIGMGNGNGRPNVFLAQAPSVLERIGPLQGRLRPRAALPGRTGLNFQLIMML